MATDDLKKTLLSLHATLASSERLDPELQALLRLLDADIHVRLTQDSLAQETSKPAAASGGLVAATMAGAGQTSPASGAAASGPVTALSSPSRAESTSGTPSSVSTSASASSSAPSPAGLGSRAQEISARFAAAHPQLEPVLRELADTLQRIGI